MSVETPNLLLKTQRLQNLIAVFHKRLGQTQGTRLSLGLTLFFLLIFSQVFKGLSLEFIALGVVLPVFIFFFKKSRRLQAFVQKLQSLQTFYQSHLDFQKGVHPSPPTAESMASVDLARDLDLPTLFQYLDRSFSIQGKKLLNEWLCQHFGRSNLSERQQHLKELVEHPGLIRRLHLESLDHAIDFERMDQELKRSFLPEGLQWKWIIPLSWLALYSSVLLGAPDLFWKLFLLIYVGSVLSFVGLTQVIFTRLQDLHLDFSSLSQKMQSLEKLSQHLSFAPHLRKKEASLDTQKINSLISIMSLRTNPILFYLLNLIVPWDFILSELSERARRQVQKHFSLWSKEIILIEALSCLAHLKTYHNTIWAQTSQDFLEAKALSHPLLSQDVVVTNDFTPNEKRIVIITGSNMSGKSTFLRAVGLNYCLANIGAPVFAEKFSFKPMQLMSCIRVSDSLRDGQSYFYAEVQRLKKILESAKKEPVLFLIDEPLRGTNNKERLIGNQHYLKQILETQSVGFISTHDLELTKLSEVDPQVVNHHFSDEWINDTLKFDYTIKEGPSQSTNALKILSQEGLYTNP